MASAGAQCEHVTHVTTQLPYVTPLQLFPSSPYLIAGFVRNVLIMLVIGFALMIATLYVIKQIAEISKPRKLRKAWQRRILDPPLCGRESCSLKKLARCQWIPMVSTGSTPVLFFIFSYPGCGHTVRMSQRRAILWHITRVPRAPLTSGRRRGHNTTFLSYEKSQSAYQIFSRSLYTFSAPSVSWASTRFAKTLPSCTPS